jgi:hypothetical protein
MAIMLTCRPDPSGFDYSGFAPAICEQVDILHQIRRDQTWQMCQFVTTADSLLADSIQGQAEEILIKPVDFTRLREAVLRLCPGSGQNESQGQKRS